MAPSLPLCCDIIQILYSVEKAPSAQINKFATKVSQEQNGKSAPLSVFSVKKVPIDTVSRRHGAQFTLIM